MQRPPRHTTVLARGLVGLAVGMLVGVAVEPWLGIWAALLAGWAALCTTTAAWVLVVVWPMDAVRTRAHARAEDPGRGFARIFAVGGSVASLGAVAVVLFQTRGAPVGASVVLAAVAVAAVAASWILIQVDYMLRIADVYYSDPVGGIDFNQDDDPMYTDFAYVALGLGMAYQVADTSVRTNQLRRIVLGQTLLAYLFGAVILATVINLVTSIG